MEKKGKLYLIPTLLGETSPERVVPEEVLAITRNLKRFIVENEKTARRYLKKASTNIPMNELMLYHLDKHTKREELPELISPLLQGENMGLLSEAGLAGIADPGAAVVSLCHEQNIAVEPLTGASSIILALIGSGMNGQQFTFHGYLPIDSGQRKKAIKQMERDAKETGYTQIFMETPFRNEKLFDDILKVCHPDTSLGVAREITTDEELVKTRPVQIWKKQKPPLHKRPSIFLIGRKQ